MADPGFDARLNVVGTLNVLEADQRASAPRDFVFTSTGGALYGEGAGERSGELPFSEEARCEPDSVYGQSKLAAEGYISLYRRAGRIAGRRLPARKRLRPAPGPRARGRRGRDLLRARPRAGARPTVFGEGTQTRDYVHVADVVGRMLAAAQGAGHAGPFNIGTGVETDVLTARRDDRAHGRARRLRARVRASPRGRDRAHGARRLPAPPPELGWRAERGLDAGLEQTLAAES